MSHKHLLFRSDAREKVLRGASALADAVRVTLGPRSRCVLIERKWGKPLVCNDGVTIAREFALKDADENLGARMLSGAAERTGEAVGDGTTTATLIAHAIVADGMRNIAAGASPIDLKRGLDRAARVAIESLRAQSRAVQTERERRQVATISAHNDPGVGELVAGAIERVGAEGAVTVEEAKGTETTLDVVEGLQFDRGYLSPYFVTHPEKMEAVLEEPFILLYDGRIGALKDIVPLLEQVARQGASLLVVAEDVEGEALATLVVNRLRGVFPNVAVKAPGFGDRRKAMLQDVAIVTGGQLIAQELGIKLENVTPEHLGRAARVVVDREHTTIVGGRGDKRTIEARCQELRTQIAETVSDYDREKLEERLAKLSGGVAVIRVGAPSEAEMKSRHEAFDDAIHATRAAVAEGIVPGAGLALLRAVPAVEAEAARLEGDERSGAMMLRRALEVPARQIAENSGVDGGVVVEKMRSGTGNFGFDAASGHYVDLVEAGIVDPSKVVRLALENAVSVAGVLLLTEATMTEVAEGKDEAGAAAAGVAP
jgi:chaperonin GroEL